MNIRVTPEGREGVWIADKDSIVDFLIGYEDDVIHNILPSGSLMLGADWSKESVIEKAQQAEQIAILTGNSYRHNLNHALSIISGNELYIFDIGEINESDLLVENK